MVRDRTPARQRISTTGEAACWDVPMDMLWPGGPTPVDDEQLADLYDYPPAIDRPYVQVSFVSSADGAVTVEGRSGGLSGPADKRVFRLGRDLADVVLVGAGTVHAEGYRGVRAGELRTERREQRGLAPLPPIAVVTARCSLEPTDPIVTDTIAPTIVFTTAAAPTHRRDALTAAGADVVACGDTAVDLAAVLEELSGRGLSRISCEGGAQLFAGLIAADLVDQLCLTVTPLLAAGDAGRIAHGPAPEAPRGLTLASVLHEDGFLMLRYGRVRAS